MPDATQERYTARSSYPSPEGRVHSEGEAFAYFT